MNKLQGFYKLADIGLPCVPWEEFTPSTKLDDDMLWTIRSAVVSGDDQNLPRLVGADAKSAMAFAQALLKRVDGIVLYYPYFIAEKSGTLEVSSASAIVECVAGDLWHLVSEGARAVTYIIESNSREAIGEAGFLRDEELELILSYVPRIRGRLRDAMASGDSALLEWSYARCSNSAGQPASESCLVFYELRTL